MTTRPRYSKIPIVIRTLALFSRAFTFFPIAAFLHLSLTQYLNRMPNLILMVAIAMIAVPAQLAWRAYTLSQSSTVSISRAKKLGRRIKWLFIAAFLALVTGAIQLLLLNPGWLVATVLQVGGTLAVWVYLARGNRGAYHTVFNDTALITSIIASLITYIVHALLRQPAPDTLLLITFVFQAAVWLLSRNQGNIDSQMSRGHHQQDALPPSIRRENMFRVSAIATVLILGILLRGPISRAVSSFFGLLRDGIGFLLRLFLSGETSIADPTRPPEPSPGMDQGGLPEPGEPSPWWNLLYVVFAIIIIYLVWTYRDHIKAWAKNLLEHIKAFIQRFLNFRDTDDAQLRANGAYVDEKVRLDRTSKGLGKRRQSKNPRKQLKTDAKDLWTRLNKQQGKDPSNWSSEDVRAVYGIVLRDLGLKEQLHRRDTTRSILRKYDKEIHQLGLTPDTWTVLYEGARYNNAPDASVQIDPDMSAQMLHALKRVADR